MSASPYVLLPPSLGQLAGGRRGEVSTSFGEFLEAPRREVLSALAQTMRSEPDQLSRKLGARGELLDHARAMNLALVENNALVMAAWRRFDGVVWTHLEPASLSSSDRRRVLVPSAPYGLLRASDVVGEYRLGFATSLAPLGALGTYWRPYVTSALCQTLRRRTVVDLLPSEHSAAIDFAKLNAVAKVRRVRFVAATGERSVGHDAKAVKGCVARAVLERGWEALEDFEWRGWHAEPDGSGALIRAPRQREVTPLSFV